MSILQARPTTQSLSMSRNRKVDVQTALHQAQASESDTVDPTTEATLAAELNRIWTRIQAHPNSYTMDQTEFGVFNRYRAQARFQNETARKAIERYWNSRSTIDGH